AWPMTWYEYPGNSNFAYLPQPGGGAIVVDRRTGQRALARTETEVHQFVAQRASAPGYLGAGDVVKKLTDTLGIQQCAPCARRQAALNDAMPRVWRRS